METSRNTTKLAQYKGHKSQHNKISTVQGTQVATQLN